MVRRNGFPGEVAPSLDLGPGNAESERGDGANRDDHQADNIGDIFGTVIHG